MEVAKSLTEIIQWGLDWAAEDFDGPLDESRTPPRIVYRGQRKAWPLIPKLYRVEPRDRDKTVHHLDHRFYSRFKREGPGYYSPFPERDWDIYVLMQHVGLPTRCLDFSESLLAAAFFAVESAKETDEPVIWGLDWAGVNESWRKRYGSTPTKEHRKRYIPKMPDETGQVDRPNLPFVAQGTAVHPRIKLQQGRFCIFGNSKEPLNQQLPDHTRILPIDPNHVGQVRQELAEAGFKRTMVFPDLDALAQDLTYRYSRDVRQPVSEVPCSDA